jgi:carboxypeptidase family protein/TonB-dependent receptor-like protein
MGAGLICNGATIRPAEGQNPAASRLQGRVITRTEAPLPEVEVTILDLSRTVLSDSAGRFDFGSVPSGDYVVRVRRIGFRGQHFSARLEASRTKDVLIVMEAGAYELPDVQVTARSLTPIEYAYTHRYDDFFRYRYLGWGLFKTRQQFENLNPVRVADILRGMSRVVVKDFMFEKPEVAIRGCNRIGIWIDGSLQYPVTGTSGDRLERIHPSHVELVAVFRGPAEMPAEAAMFVQNDCAIMIWTR